MYCLLIKIGNLHSAYNNFINHYDSSYTKRILMESLDLFADLWIYLIFGILLTTTIKIFITKEQIAEFFKKNYNSSIIIAAFIGVISPVGSYAIIPLSVALFLVGTPLPALIALLISSPLINPNLFLLTMGAFNLEIAILRTFSAFILGITGGYLTALLINLKYIQIDKVVSDRNKFNNAEINPPSGYSFSKKFGIELFKMTKYISKFFFLAILLAAAIKILTPPNLMIKLFNGNNFMSVLISTGAGIPFYVCGGASIPVVQQLADLGMSKGAVLAFFISGPITKISNLLLIQSVFNFKIFIFYFSVGIMGAFIIGLLYNLF